MKTYDGITAESFWLLGQNRFHNSKEFYEVNKAAINAGVIHPMRQIAEILAENFVKIDERMNLIPSKMVSRIRRDTRFSNDKRLYRENVWIMFMRPKTQWPYHPCMWFEIAPGGYSYGVGSYETTPAFMELYRTALTERTAEFLAAARSAEATGASFYAQQYKRDKNPALTGQIKTYYNAKSLYFMVRKSDVTALENEDFLRDVRAAYTAFTPMYRFLKDIADAYVSGNAQAGER